MAPFALAPLAGTFAYFVIFLLLGIDHEKLTVRHNGLDRRLTDVHGHVIQEILA